MAESTSSRASNPNNAVNPSRDLGRKTSVIWEFFTVDEDNKFAICDECEAKVPRGGSTTKSNTTTNLVNYLKDTHKSTQNTWKEKQKSSRWNKEMGTTATVFFKRSPRPK